MRSLLATGAATAAVFVALAAPALAAPPTPRPITCTDECYVDPVFYKTWLSEFRDWATSPPKPSLVPCPDACSPDPSAVKPWVSDVVDWAIG